MSAPHPPSLDRVRLGVSIAAALDGRGRELDGREVNRTVERLCRQVLAAEAGLVFGHDWRPEGVMAQVLAVARTYQRTGDTEPRLINLVPWPEEPVLPAEERRFLADLLRVERIGLPAALADKETEIRGQPNGEAYLRARALTELRRALTVRCTARVCLGGKTAGRFQGRLPGIAEEALLALENGQPLYLSALYGGAAQDVIDALTPGMPDGSAAWQPAAPIRDGYRVLGPRYEPGEPDAAIDPADVWQRLAAIGVDGVARGNALTPAENERLFRAHSVSEVVDWTMLGLSRLAAGPPRAVP
jgi:hypothetical protein